MIKQKIEKMTFSSGQQAALDYILQMEYQIEHMSVHDIAKASYTSASTVVRLAQKLGYQGFEEFKHEFLKELTYQDSHFQDINPNFPFQQNDSIQNIAGKITQLSKEAMDDTLSLITHDTLQKALQILKKAQVIHLSAISYPLLLGQMFQLNMNRLGKMVNIPLVIGEELFTLSTMKKEDCLLLISYSGQIENMIKLAQSAKAKGIPIIVITSLGDNQLKQYSDVVLYISTREKLYSKIGGFVNENSIKLILDILYSCYFQMDYEENIHRRIDISKQSEHNRFATYEVMKEE